MSLLYELPEQSIIAEQYVTDKHGRELVILVPEWLHQHSNELIENQKEAIKSGAVSMESKTGLEAYSNWEMPPDRSLIYQYFNVPPVGRELLHIIYPGLVPFSWIETQFPTRTVVAGIFGVLKMAWFDKWFDQSSFTQADRNLERNVNVIMKRHSKYFKRYLYEKMLQNNTEKIRSAQFSPLMYLPLRSDMSDHTKVSYLPVERAEGPIQPPKICSSITPTFPIYHRIPKFDLSDVGEEGWFYGIRTFKLSDEKELESFYLHRLKLIPKKALDKITFCWLQRIASRLPTKTTEIVCLELSKQEKSDVIKKAMGLLLRHGLDKAKFQAPWIEDLREATTRIFNETSANLFASGEEGYRVVVNILPSLFYVAQCHEHYHSQPTTLDMMVEWQCIKKCYEVFNEENSPPRISCC